MKFLNHETPRRIEIPPFLLLRIRILFLVVSSSTKQQKRKQDEEKWRIEGVENEDEEDDALGIGFEETYRFYDRILGQENTASKFSSFDGFGLSIDLESIGLER